MRNRGEVSSVPGLAQVLSACEMLTRSNMSSITVSIASGASDANLIALSREVAEEDNLRIECEQRGRMLVLRFTREQM